MELVRKVCFFHLGIKLAIHEKKYDFMHLLHNRSLLNEFPCKFGSLWHEWASLKRKWNDDATDDEYLLFCLIRKRYTVINNTLFFNGKSDRLSVGDI
jgi:hypothetical protein